MVGWMDDEALHRTLTTGRATFWSRSRREYWRKGDTSGQRAARQEVRLDCDGDALLVVVDQVGAACHTGDRTCFDADVLLSEAAPRPRVCSATGAGDGRACSATAGAAGQQPTLHRVARAERCSPIGEQRATRQDAWVGRRSSRGGSGWLGASTAVLDGRVTRARLGDGP